MSVRRERRKRKFYERQKARYTPKAIPMPEGCKSQWCNNLRCGLHPTKDNQGRTEPVSVVEWCPTPCLELDCQCHGDFVVHSDACKGIPLHTRRLKKKKGLGKMPYLGLERRTLQGKLKQRFNH
jgi:hypothetical protein